MYVKHFLKRLDRNRILAPNRWS